MNKNRLEAFSDGVFAIATTLLVLGISIPQGKVESDRELALLLVGMIPSILTFVFTFLVVGVFWVAHHRIFNLTRSVDNVLIWQNNFYLLTVAIIPFPAAVLARHPFFRTAVLFYAVILLVVASQHFLLLRHIYKKDELRQPFFNVEVYRVARMTATVGPACYLAAAAISTLSSVLSFILILAALFFYIVLSNRIRVFERPRAE